MESLQLGKRNLTDSGRTKDAVLSPLENPKKSKPIEESETKTSFEKLAGGPVGASLSSRSPGLDNVFKSPNFATGTTPSIKNQLSDFPSKENFKDDSSAVYGSTAKVHEVKTLPPQRPRLFLVTNRGMRRENGRISFTRERVIKMSTRLYYDLDHPDDNVLEGCDLKDMVSPATVLLYIHGFNNTVDNAVKDAWEIGQSLQLDYVVCFAWPSKESPYCYYTDKLTASNSQNELWNVLLQLRNALNPSGIQGIPGIQGIHILAHSMGNYLLGLAFERFNSIQSEFNGVRFGHLFSAAADHNHDEFAVQLNAAINHFTRITIYMSQTDRALIVSKILANQNQENPSKVGLYNPIFQADNERLIKVQCVYSGPILPSDDRFGHAYFRLPSVAADMRYQIHTTDETVSNPQRNFTIRNGERNVFQIMYP